MALAFKSEAANNYNRGKDSYGIIYFHVNIDFIIPARADGLLQAQKCIAYSGRIKTY